MLKIILCFKLFIVFLLICHEAHSETSNYNIPQAQIKVFHPSGFEVSIPAERGTEKYEFHGKKVQEHNSKWNGETDKMENGRYNLSFKDENTELKIGDIFYYYSTVIYNGMKYIGEVEEFVVKEYENLKAQHNGNKYGNGSNQDSYGTYGNNQHGNGDYSVNDRQSTNDEPIHMYSRNAYLANDYGTPERSPILYVTQDMDTICKPSRTIFNSGKRAQCANQIIFEEEFNGNTLNVTKWKIERRFSTQPDYEFVVYSTHKKGMFEINPLTIDKGVASLQPLRVKQVFGPNFLRNANFDLGINCTGILGTEECFRNKNGFDHHPPLMSAKFSTKEHFSFKFGKIAIRARLPNSDWSFPQIFLEPLENYYGRLNYSSGQMRVAFISRGPNEDKLYNLYGGVLLSSNPPLRTAQLCKLRNPRNQFWSQDFHIYTLVWTPDEITLSVDGTVYCTINPNEGFYTIREDGVGLPNVENLRKSSNMAPFDREFYVTIGYGVGGHNDFPDQEFDAKPWENGERRPMSKFWNHLEPGNNWKTNEAAFQIDYVRVYAV